MEFWAGTLTTTVCQFGPRMYRSPSFHPLPREKRRTDRASPSPSPGSACRSIRIPGPDPRAGVPIRTHEMRSGKLSAFIG